MIKLLCTISIILFLVTLWNCNKNPKSAEFEDDFFPLKVGLKWQYRLITSKNETNQPEEFTVEVIGRKTINNITYYEIENYFTIGSSNTNPAYIRIEDDCVFTSFNDEEYLLYSFCSDDSSSWHLPLYVSPTIIHDFYTDRFELNSEEANILWWMGKDIGRSEYQWTEVFTKGIGRTKIIWSAMGGSGEWHLQ